MREAEPGNEWKMDYERKIKEILGPGGTVSRSIPGYEHRHQQVRMAVEVFNAIMSGDRLIIEAPTGTGKTLAYLVAAALSRKRVAISTGTKNLQEQLFFKDIPFVRKNVFPKLKAALLKGRGNFVCHTRFISYMRQPRLEGFGHNDSLKEITEWYRKTVEHGRGDRAEMKTLPDDDPVWPEICSTMETCLGKKCSKREDCFVLKMRARGVQSDLMIVNHHLLASDLTVKESGFGEVIPRYDALIVDEAHGLEEALTQHFGFHFSRFRILRLVRDAKSQLAEMGEKADKFQKTLNAIEIDGRRVFEGLEGLLANVQGQRVLLPRLDLQLGELRDGLSKSLETLGAMLSNLPKAPEEVRSLIPRAELARVELDTILADERNDDYACWAERRDRALILHASPVEVGPMLRSKLYEKVPATVFTSATLSSGGNFDYSKSRLGLDDDPPPTETILDSPFDYSSQTMLYVPRSMPEPNSPGFADALAPVLEKILGHTRGRAFILFTSYRNMQAVHDRMQGRVPYPLLIQGSRPRTRLLQEFKDLDGAVLFATSSFWEGVDVQGEALSCVAVDKLPFAPPDDPILSSRIQRIRNSGGSPFFSLQVPMAVIALKQGLGRLIRTRSDRGVLCVLDTRILTKRYGKIFLKSLYSSPLSRRTHDIERFFEQ